MNSRTIAKEATVHILNDPKLVLSALTQLFTYNSSLMFR